jgi:hypothetical protein
MDISAHRTKPLQQADTDNSDNDVKYRKLQVHALSVRAVHESVQNQTKQETKRERERERDKEEEE